MTIYNVGSGVSTLHLTCELNGVGSGQHKIDFRMEYTSNLGYHNQTIGLGAINSNIIANLDMFPKRYNFQIVTRPTMKIRGTMLKTIEQHVKGRWALDISIIPGAHIAISKGKPPAYSHNIVWSFENRNEAMAVGLITKSSESRPWRDTSEM